MIASLKRIVILICPYTLSNLSTQRSRCTRAQDNRHMLGFITLHTKDAISQLRLLPTLNIRGLLTKTAQNNAVSTQAIDDKTTHDHGQTTTPAKGKQQLRKQKLINRVAPRQGGSRGGTLEIRTLNNNREDDNDAMCVRVCATS